MSYDAHALLCADICADVQSAIAPQHPPHVFASAAAPSTSVLGGLLSAAALEALVRSVVNAGAAMVRQPLEDLETAHLDGIRSFLGAQVIVLITEMADKLKPS